MKTSKLYLKFPKLSKKPKIMSWHYLVRMGGQQGLGRVPGVLQPSSSAALTARTSHTSSASNASHHAQ